MRGQIRLLPFFFWLRFDAQPGGSRPANRWGCKSNSRGFRIEPIARIIKNNPKRMSRQKKTAYGKQGIVQRGRLPTSAIKTSAGQCGRDCRGMSTDSTEAFRTAVAVATLQGMDLAALQAVLTAAATDNQIRVVATSIASPMMGSGYPPT